MFMIFFICILVTAQNSFGSQPPFTITSAQNNPTNMVLRLKISSDFVIHDIRLGESLHHKTGDGKKISTHAILTIIINGVQYFTYYAKDDFRHDTHNAQLRRTANPHAFLVIIPPKKSEN